jgi:hypothetical protein
MQTHGIGRAFYHTIRVKPDTAFLHTAPTVEIEPPYRRSDSLIVRVPFTPWAIVLGWWEDTGWDPEEALMEAVSGWGINPYEDNLQNPEVAATIRQNVAAWSKDLDSEWTVVQALGVHE